MTRAANARPAPPRLVLVTDRHATAGRDLVAVVSAALDAGLPAVQLRDKDLSGRARFALAEQLRVATAARGALLLVNERIDVALAVGADGVHLGGGALPIDVVRGLVGSERLIGVSIHTPGEPTAGADFAFFGPVWPTPGKTPQDPARLAEAVRAAAVPVLAIGGVTAARVPLVREAGAVGVAVIREILAAADPAAATHGLLAALAVATPAPPD
ncbi:MAG TPA: thiamine phosphate synthase [Candidatus Binatia bacterium]|nr:thiamine phosphate synthase [Candidatus Binatia bacterium]